MDESTKNSPCKECKDGADEVQLQSEVEHLRQHLSERDAHIVAVEAEFIKCTSRLQDFEEQVSTWREKYERLYDSHKRVQKLNQVLEEKLLQMVDKMKGEKSQLTKDIATLSVRLAEAKYNCGMLQKENERYKNDMNLAIQLLQCKPDNFVAQKLDNLPSDTQARVSQYVMSKTSKPSGSVQSKGSNVNEIDNFDTSEYEFNISASLMSKILEDSIQDTVTKHCDTCTCNKSQNKPFCYNDSQYTVSTQTNLSGEMKSSLCINCNTEIKSIHSNMSMRSSSPHGIKIINEKITGLIPGPLYIMPQQHPVKQCNVNYDKIDLNKILINDHNEVTNNLEKNNVLDTLNKDTNSKISDNMPHRKLTVMNMEPAVHHKLCDRSKTSISSKNSITSVHNEDLLIKEVVSPNDSKPKQAVQSADNVSLRKNSHSSMGAVSRTSSLAKSTVSNQKSNTQVGPGPRFCHLRMQAGSKNILLDNAQPDVPPVLYRRQSKCNENPIFKDLNDGMDDFIDFNKTDTLITMEDKTSNVVESTLIDVHVDNHVKESNEVSDTNTPINPVLLNVSSSPLQPLKTHNFLNTSENNNNTPQNTEHTSNNFENDNLINNFNLDINKNSNNNHQLNKYPFSPTDSHDIKIFNFDRYEQKIASQYNKSLKKIDMSQLHSLENTKISKDFPPQGELPKLDKMSDAPSKVIPAIVNVYPNLSQTHLKANEKLTNEQSTSSLSSDDSAAVLQKQQLLRVAEWVEKNLEQQNSFKEPLDEELNFSNRAARRDSKLSRLTETLNELALNMPHPVSKYSKSYTKDAHVPNNWVHNNVVLHKPTLDEKSMKLTQKLTPNIVKETIFPVECGDATYTEVTTEARIVRRSSKDACKELREVFKSDSDKEISPEELARMEYNVKRFLLSGPQWITPESGGRTRRTSSKTETDV